MLVSLQPPAHGFCFRFMRQMTTEKLFDDGKYMVIYLEPETILPKENEQFLKPVVS